jgi:hypothetical protein
MLQRLCSDGAQPKPTTLELVASRAGLARKRPCICVRGGLSSPDYASGLAYKPAMCVASLRSYHNRGAGAKLPELVTSLQ